MMSYFGILASFIVLLPLVLGYIGLFLFLFLSLFFDVPFCFGLHKKLLSPQTQTREVAHVTRFAA